MPARFGEVAALGTGVVTTTVGEAQWAGVEGSPAMATGVGIPVTAVVTRTVADTTMGPHPMVAVSTMALPRTVAGTTLAPPLMGVVPAIRAHQQALQALLLRRTLDKRRLNRPRKPRGTSGSPGGVCHNTSLGVNWPQEKTAPWAVFSSLGDHSETERFLRN